MSKKILVCISIFVLSVLVFSACTPTTAVVNSPDVVAEEAVNNGSGNGSGGGDGSGGGNGSGSGDKVAEETITAGTETAALSVTGKVENELFWTEEDVKALNFLDVESTNSKGETETYTGVLIADLLSLAGLKPNAETLVLVADDGYTAEIALADIMACDNCILSFRSKGGFSSVIPGAENSLQVKGVVELQVK